MDRGTSRAILVQYIFEMGKTAVIVGKQTQREHFKRLALQDDRTLGLRE
jgi:hypothetical protein